MKSRTRQSSMVLAAFAALAFLPKPSEASVIEYAYRGKIRTIQNVRRNTDPMIEQWTNLLGAPIQVGDPYEITLTFEPREPHNVWFDNEQNPSRSAGAYRFPRDAYTFGFRIGEHEFGESLSPGTLSLEVHDSMINDGLWGSDDYIRAQIPINRAGAGPQEYLIMYLGSGGGTLLDGVGLPTELSIDDFPFVNLSLTPWTLVSDDVATEIYGMIDAFEVTTADATPGSPTPADPSTPVPEPGMMTLFGGMTLAVLAWRRLRLRSGG